MTSPRHPRRTAASLIVECLEAEGCRWVFSVPGEETMGILDALSRSESVQHVTTRHEQGAAFMADVHGRLTGRPAVAMATLGPGATNLLTGIAAALAQVLADPASPVPMVGASGAISGVMGAYLVLFPRIRVFTLIPLGFFITTMALPAWVMLGYWFLLQAFNSYLSFGIVGGGVAHLAHTGGFVAGVALTLPLWLARGGPAFWRRTHGHPQHAATRVTERLTPIPRVPRGRR